MVCCGVVLRRVWFRGAVCVCLEYIDVNEENNCHIALAEEQLGEVRHT